MGDYRLVSVDSGEIWEIEENDFRWNPGRYYKNCISNVKWFREHYPYRCKVVSYIQCYHNGLYYGMIGVSDLCVQWIDNRFDPKTGALKNWSRCVKERMRRRK